MSASRAYDALRAAMLVDEQVKRAGYSTEVLIAARGVLLDSIRDLLQSLPEGERARTVAELNAKGLLTTKPKRAN